MSQLAGKLKAVETEPVRVRRGPLNQCHSLYGDGDLDDFEAIQAKREAGLSWREVQELVDEQLGIEKPIGLEKFRYHFRRRCFCWPDELRLQ